MRGKKTSEETPGFRGGSLSKTIWSKDIKYYVKMTGIHHGGRIQIVLKPFFSRKSKFLVEKVRSFLGSALKPPVWQL